MASQNDPERVLSGSLNLLPAGDQIPATDALVLEGFRADQDGMLRTRKGFNVEASIAGGGIFHTLARSGNDRYAGVGTALYYGNPEPLTTGISSAFDGNRIWMVFYQGIAWAMNRGAQLQLDASAAGGMGYAPTPNNWSIQPPATAPTATLQQPITDVFNPYQPTGGVQPFHYVGYWVQGVVPPQFVFLINTDNPALAANPDANGDSVQFNVNPAINPNFGAVATVIQSAIQAPWLLVTEYSPGFDTTFNGVAADGDAFHFFFYADDPTQISSVYIQLYSDENLYGQNAPMVACNFDQSRLTPAQQSMTPLHILRAINLDVYSLPQDSGPTGTFPDPTAVQQLINTLAIPHFMEYLGGQQYTSFDPSFTPVINNGLPTFDQGGLPVTAPFQYNSNWITPAFNWANVTACVITVTLAGPTTFGLNLATVSQGLAAGQWNGSITFYVSFANASDQDSNPTLDSNGNLVGVTVAPANQNITLTGIPVSPDPQVTQRWIYAVGGGLSEPLRVAVISDNSTTTWSTFDSVPTAQNNYVQMPVNRTPAPPAAGVVGPYLGRLIAWNAAAVGTSSPAYPARYMWTPVAEPWFFPGWDEESGNWEDVGADEDPIMTITYHKQMLFIYKQKSIWRLPGDPDSNDAVQGDSTFGAVGPAAVATAGAIDFVVGPEGVYIFDGDFTTKVSPALDPLFKGDFIFINASETWVPIDPANIVNSVLAVINDRLYFSYPSLGQTIPDTLLVMHIPTRRWVSVARGSRYVTAANYEGAGNFLLLGETTPSGAVMETAERFPADFDGGAATAIAVEWQSRYLDQGLPDNYKRYSDLEIDFQTAGPGESAASTLTVSVCDENGLVTQLGTISSLTRTTCAPFNIAQILGADLRGKRCAIRITGNVTSTCIIYGAYLRWYPEERVASTFDSGFMDDERAHQCDYIEMAMTGSGQAGTVTLASDLPGSLLTQRQAPSIVVPNGRGNVRQRLASIVEGRNLRFRVSSPATFQLHKMRIRQRVVGEYVDGAIGEYWESPEFSVAPGRVGELKDLLLDYDASAAGQLLIYSDLPGNALSVVRTLTIPQRSTRAPFVFGFEDSLDTLPYGQLFKARVIPPPTGVIRLHGRATLRARLIGTFFDGSAGEIWETQQLDLVGGTGLYREVALVAQCGGPMTFTFETELPEQEVQTVASYNFDTTQSGSYTGREPIYFRLPGNTKGKLSKCRISGPYWARIFEVRLYGRGLGNTSTPWSWLNVPLDPTPDEFQQIQLPVRETPEAFDWMELPVDAIE